MNERPRTLGRRTRVGIAAGLALGIVMLDVALPAQHFSYGLIVPLILFSRAYGLGVALPAAFVSAFALTGLERHNLHQHLDALYVSDSGLLAAVWVAVVMIVERYEDVLVRSYQTAAERVAMENAAKMKQLASESYAVQFESVRARERDLAAIADAIPQMVWRASRDGVAEYFSNAWVAYTGLEPERLRSVGIEGVIHPGDQALARERWSFARTDGSLFDCECRLRRHDGTYRWFLTRAIALRGRGGEVERWFGTATDIEEQKRAHAQLEQRYERAHHVSETFQEASLPASLPTIAGIVFSAIYRAGRREAAVGGDWYDALRLIDGRIVVSVGDVSGSGLGAAITMIATRQAMRGAAQIHADPASILEAADRTLREEASDRMVTAFVGVYDPVTRLLSYASAGHPPPLLRRAGGDVVDLQAPGLPLGVRRKGDTESRDIQVDPGAFLVLYTDGLVESTHDVIAGHDRLHETVARIDTERPLGAAERIATAMLAGAQRDDVAVMTLAFSTGGTGARYHRWSFDSFDPSAAKVCHGGFVAALATVGAKDPQIVDAEVVLAELVGNVVRHANGAVEIVLDATGEAPVVSVLDRGPGFSQAAFLPVDALSESGRGLFIVRSLTADFHASRRPGGGTHARAVLLIRCKPVPAQPLPGTAARVMNGISI